MHLKKLVALLLRYVRSYTEQMNEVMETGKV